MHNGDGRNKDAYENDDNDDEEEEEEEKYDDEGLCK